MSNDIFLILVTAAVGVAAMIPMLLIPILFGPKRPNVIKESTFECGQPPNGAIRVSMMMQYYAYLLLFVVFDVLSMFLFTWGVSYLATGLIGSIIMVIFIVIMIIPMAYTLYNAGKRELW